VATEDSLLPIGKGLTVSGGLLVDVPIKGSIVFDSTNHPVWIPRARDHKDGVGVVDGVVDVVGRAVCTPVVIDQNGRVGVVANKYATYGFVLGSDVIFVLQCALQSPNASAFTSSLSY